MEYNNRYDNTFTMKDYFAKNYGLPAKPSAPDLTDFKMWGCIMMLCLFWLWIPIFIVIKIKNNKATAKYNEALKAWEAALEFRSNNWWKEYDKIVDKTIASLNLKEDGMKKLNIADSHLTNEIIDKETGNQIPLVPFYIYGQDFSQGCWRMDSRGTYRTSCLEFTQFFFTQKEIMIYIRKIDLLNPDAKKEIVQELFYSDITSVTISQDSVSTKKAEHVGGGGKNIDEVEVERFCIIVPGDKMAYGYTANDNTTKNINNMRSMIRIIKNK